MIFFHFWPFRNECLERKQENGHLLNKINGYVNSNHRVFSTNFK